MTQTRKRTPAPKIMLRLDSRSSLADDLGVFGRTVGPRRGPQRRDTRQKEDYCLRRWLIAMAMMDRLSFPVLVEASTVGNESPDFLLTFGEGSALGVEVTEAGSANWQQWLTLNEGMRRLYSGNGYVDREPEDIVIRDVIEALERKLRKLDRGRHAGAC